MRRRKFLLSLLLMAVGATAARARILVGGEAFTRRPAKPPTPVDPAAGWQFFKPDEARLVEAIVDRLIPADELSIGAREAGCAVFMDRQLAGPYGQSATWYLAGPAQVGTPQQGPQSIETIATRLRAGLAALLRFCASQPGGKAFESLAAAEQDAILTKLETGQLGLDGVDEKGLFGQLLHSAREGFFADPIYGGNKDMAGWRMLGFPGARYDYRDVIGRRGEVLDLDPVGLVGLVGRSQ